MLSYSWCVLAYLWSFSLDIFTRPIIHSRYFKCQCSSCFSCIAIMNHPSQSLIEDKTPLCTTKISKVYVGVRLGCPSGLTKHYNKLGMKWFVSNNISFVVKRLSWQKILSRQLSPQLCHPIVLETNNFILLGKHIYDKMKSHGQNYLATRVFYDVK